MIIPPLVFVLGMFAGAVRAPSDPTDGLTALFVGTREEPLRGLHISGGRVVIIPEHGLPRTWDGVSLRTMDARMAARYGLPLDDRQELVFSEASRAAALVERVSEDHVVVRGLPLVDSRTPLPIRRQLTLGDDGATVAGWTGEGDAEELAVYSIAAEEPVGALQRPDVEGFSLSPSGATVTLWSDRATVVADRTGRVLHRLPWSFDAVESRSGEWRVLLSACEATFYRGGEEVLRVETEGPPRCAAFSEEASHAVVADASTLYRVNLQRRASRPIRRVDPAFGYRSAAVRNDGLIVAGRLRVERMPSRSRVGAGNGELLGGAAVGVLEAVDAAGNVRRSARFRLFEWNSRAPSTEWLDEARVLVRSRHTVYEWRIR